MAFHEGDPWKDPKRARRTDSSRIVVGCILAVALLIVLAVIDLEAAIIVAVLAALTALILFATSRRRRSP
ncbi:MULTISPECIES: hypothetical protein [unclassified Streptomyces]|uniref:hypothetical protein n=1 Tax=unclassified Streptomyces TaxID=2593676 RepID=UPI002E3352CD|nr:hypothetical protein [Streptomyces sp. NBC_01428]